jgi:hypothetical protein
VILIVVAGRSVSCVIVIDCVGGVVILVDDSIVRGVVILFGYSSEEEYVSGSTVHADRMQSPR